MDQLICLDGPEGDKLCAVHCPEEVVCTNPNKGKKASDFVCSPNPQKTTIALKEAKINCDESNNNTSFKIGSCNIEISLKKVEAPKDNGGNSGNDESWIKKNMGYVIGGSIAAVLVLALGAAGYTQFRKRRS